MSKNNIGKKILGIALVGAVIGGAIAFFKNFEKKYSGDSSDDSFNDPEDCQSGQCSGDCCCDDQPRSYTTIAGDDIPEGPEEENIAPAQEPNEEIPAFEQESEEASGETETINNESI